MEPREDTIFDEDAPSGKGSLAQINFNINDSGRWLLKVIGGPNNGAEFAMQASTSYLIGTDPNSCDIVFHDTSVSRQHARISVGSDERLTIEDLRSRNGTLVDGEPLKGKRPLASNNLVSMGTTSFIVFDREGEMHTIISPLLPSIVKVLQKDEDKKEESSSAQSSAYSKNNPETPAPARVKHRENTFGAFILIAIIVGLFVIAGMGISTLFKSEPIVQKEAVDTSKILDGVMKAFPSVKYSFNKSTGRLLLVGHVLNATDKNALLYDLQGLNFIKDIDDTGVVIDEYVWQEINQLIARNPAWKGITVQATAPGKFVLNGYLQTRKQSEQLSDYITANFPYLDLLQKKVLVDEDVIGSVTNGLQNYGFKDVNVQLSNGELTLTGNVPNGKLAPLNKLVDAFKNISGIRNVRNYVVELAPEASMVNITDRYQVTGYSQSSNNGNISVVINGRILSKGDVLDGMTITDVKSNMILLDKDGTKYRIDFSK